MKAQKIFAVLVLGAFVLVQCTKEPTLQSDEKSLESRSDLNNSSLTIQINCMNESFPGDHTENILPQATIKVQNIDQSKLSLIPPGIIGNCSPIEAIFDITIIDYPGNSFWDYVLFTDFKLVIPESQNCENLKNYLDDLAITNYQLYLQTLNQLSTYIALEGKHIFMSKYVNKKKIVDGSSEARVYFAKCYRPVEMSGLIPIYDLSGSDDPRDWVIIGYKSVEYIDFVPCGEGCCKFTQKYRYDPVRGEVVTDAGEWVSTGACDPGSKECTQRCQ